MKRIKKIEDKVRGGEKRKEYKDKRSLKMEDK